MSTLLAVVIPDFGDGSKKETCEEANHTFCTSWVHHNWDSTLWPALRDHIEMTLIAVVIGFAIAFTLALVAYRHSWFERPVTLLTTVIYTIPSLALFELLVPIKGFGLSRTTAEVALVSYTLLILFRNTLIGLREVPPEIRESARGMGMTPRQSLIKVELPLALPAIIAGLRIATVTVISLATVAAFVSDEGLGKPIFDAINNGLFKTELIAAGGLAVILAIIADILFVGVQRILTPWARAGERSR